MTPHYAQLADWQTTWTLITGLWPKWQPSTQQKELWEDELRPMQQIPLRKAIKQCAVKSKWREPALVNIASARQAKPMTNTHSYSSSPHTQAEADQEVGEMRADLLALDAETLAHAVEAANAVVPGSLLGTDNRDVKSWPNGRVGFVHAAYQDSNQ